MELKGKTAIVTGSGRGIGEGIVVAMAREGANVVVMDRKLENAVAVVDKIVAEGGSAMAAEADVTKSATIDAMVVATVKRFGALDILVNNAGIEAPPALTHEITEEQWDRVLGVNLKGVFLCCRAVIPQMIKQNSGRIIQIASTAAVRMSFFGSIDYTTSKHGVAGFSHHLAWELADYRITVNTICPGGVMTPLMEQGSTPEFRDMVSKRLIPMGRMCTPDEIAQAAIFLGSDRAAMITGQMLAVDGGLLVGFGEDLRAVVRKRMDDMKKSAASHG